MIIYSTATWPVSFVNEREDYSTATSLANFANECKSYLFNCNKTCQIFQIDAKIIYLQQGLPTLQINYLLRYMIFKHRAGHNFGTVMWIEKEN